MNCVRTNTDYGFVLVVDTDSGFDVEAYGMTGIGRYELFYACVCDSTDNPEEFVAEAANHENVPLYRKTKAALA
jgi:hypothetical protein